MCWIVCFTFWRGREWKGKQYLKYDNTTYFQISYWMSAVLQLVGHSVPYFQLKMFFQHGSKSWLLHNYCPFQQTTNSSSKIVDILMPCVLTHLLAASLWSVIRKEGCLFCGCSWEKEACFVRNKWKVHIFLIMFILWWECIGSSWRILA